MRIDGNKKVALIADFAKEAVKLCEKMSKDAKLSMIVERTDKLEKDTTAAIKSERVASGLEEADSARDATFSAIGYFLKGATYSPDAAVNAAAKTALADFEKYGRNITTARYEEETTYIRSYLADVSSAKYEDITAKVAGLKDLFDKLASEQNAFDTAYTEFMSAASVGKKSATAIKKELVAILNKCLLPYVEALGFIDDEYKALAGELEARLARIK